MRLDPVTMGLHLGLEGETSLGPILITGGAGFIGSHPCDRPLAPGDDVIVLDAPTPPVHRGRRPQYRRPRAHI